MNSRLVIAAILIVVGMPVESMARPSSTGLGNETAYSGIKGYLSDRSVPAPTTSVVTDENSVLYDHDKAGLRWNSYTPGKDRGVSGSDPGWGQDTANTAPSQQ